MPAKIQIEQNIKAIRKIRVQYEGYQRGLIALLQELTYEDKLFIYCTLRSMIEAIDE